MVQITSENFREESKKPRGNSRYPDISQFAWCYNRTRPKLKLLNFSHISGLPGIYVHTELGSLTLVLFRFLVLEVLYPLHPLHHYAADWSFFTSG